MNLKPNPFPSHVIGLTGGIASGKSTVAQYLREKGYPVIDADQVAKTIRETEAKNEIFKRFGSHDPKVIRDLIFKDPLKRLELEALLHPLIQKQSQKLIQDAFQKSAIVFYEAALLIEAGRSKDFEQVLLIEAPEELQIKWLCKRAHLDPKLDRQLIDSILKSQLSPEEKRKQATDLIINDSTIETLRHKVDQFLLKLK